MGAALAKRAFAPPDLGAEYEARIGAAGGVLEFVDGPMTRGPPIPVATFHCRDLFPFPAPRDVTVLYSHGNAEDLGTSAKWLRALARQSGHRIVAYDYTGYGKARAPGAKPSEAGVLNNVVDVYTHVLKTHPRTTIVLAGFSLGSGPSCYLAGLRPVGLGGLLLLAPFTSILSVGVGSHVAKSTGVLDMFANSVCGSKIRCPTLVVHGTEDTLTKPFHAEALAAAVPTARKVHWVKGADHGSILTVILQDPGHWAVVKAFLDAGGL